MKLSELKPNPKNPRSITKPQVEKLKASIKKFPKMMELRPIVHDKDGIVLGGNMRLRALGELGYDELPENWTKLADDLSEDEKREFIIKDNVGFGSWDFEELANEYSIEELEAWGMEKVVFEEPEPEAGDTDPDDIPAKPEKPTVKRGDVYQLGDHKLMCGNSTVVADIEKLMKGELADAMWTDPPYNVDYESSDGSKIKNDNMANAQFREFLLDSFSCAFSCMKEGAPLYVSHADTEGYNFRGAFIDAGFKLSGCLIWKKTSLVLGRSDYQWQHEPILYGWKPGSKHQWFGGRNKTTAFETSSNPLQVLEDGSITVTVGFETIKISGESLKINEVETAVIYHEKQKKNADHPTMKPVSLIGKMLRNSTQKGDIVLDLFGGSGSTMISCEQLKRKCYMIELDEKYCDVIIRRWEEFTGKKAKKL